MIKLCLSLNPEVNVKLLRHYPVTATNLQGLGLDFIVYCMGLRVILTQSGVCGNGLY